MPRYFFTIQASNGVLEDDRVSEALPDIPAALARAERMIGELQKEGGYEDAGLKILVKDESQQTVLFLPFIACGD
jgi:dipeptidase